MFEESLLLILLAFGWRTQFVPYHSILFDDFLPKLQENQSLQTRKTLKIHPIHSPKALSNLSKTSPSILACLIFLIISTS